MASVDRALARGTRRGERALVEFGDLVREARIGAGLSQAALGKAVGMSGAQISRIQRGKLPSLSVVDASRIASVLGMDLRLAAYPAGDPLRDAAHAERVRRLLQHVRSPLRYRVDEPLPRRPDQPTELRAWDAVVYGHGRRTGVEVEMRVRDVQALIRRNAMKRRDDPMDGFLLILADTHNNRRVLRENLSLFPDLPRLRRNRVLASLMAGEHPPSGIIMI